MNTHGFTLVREEQLSEVSGTVKLWRHEATGAELLSVLNGDENKCFGATFRTPPKDSTGVAHILEHSVLCGSEKYPVKEPFVELLKGSLQTFLNAFTFPDKTCYPVASANLQDFYNLVDVYLDAVFFPRIDEKCFQQEGWHIEADSAEGPLRYKGVVYNEMKGVYSSPDSVLAEHSQQSLFPDMTYGLDSGGNPEVIPQLTYKAFKAFHESHYHPSNTRFFFWGDDPEERRFALLAPYLSRFTARETDSAVPLQPRLDVPRQLEFPYAAGEDGDKGHVALNWLTCETADTGELLVLEMLEHILLGLPGSPLRKALIESGLGEDLTGSGLETDLRQTFFSVGLRSIVPGTAEDVEMLIMETLADLAENGVPAPAVEAAVNSVEFDLRENNSGRFPRGLAAMIRSLATWLYDGDPIAPLAWEKPLAALKARLASGEKVFEDAIRRWFLDNEHRSTVILTPDANLAAEREAAEAAKLQRLYDALSDDDHKELVALTEALRASQQAPDSPEALAAIPSLTLGDLPRENTPIPKTEDTAGDLAVLAHDIDTSGILYAEILFPLDAVPAELLPLVPLMGRSLTEMGTSKRDFVELGTLLASKTGGMDASPLVATLRGARTPVAKLCLGGKATADKADDLFALMAEVLTDADFDNRQRFTQMVLEERARLEQSLIPSGHGTVITRLRAAYSLSGRISEALGGVTYLEAIRALSDRVVSDWDSVRADLEILRGLILNRQDAVLNLTADAKTLAAAQPYAAALGRALPTAFSVPLPLDPLGAPINEALLVPAQVNYVGKGCNIYDLGYNWHGSAHVITRHLRMGWLWDQVRVQGGAYGAFCSLDRMSGTLAQVSYRDPNVEKTLATYDATADYLRKLDLSDRDLTLAIVGAIGDLDTYLLPDARGAASLARHLTDDRDDLRQQMREEILGTTRRHFTEFAEVMAEAARAGTVCVLGGSAAENAATAHGWNISKVL
uniref:insulinase family protein n=1 Tax=uncultured Bilophila sp. TaxID=529385 RepID=UPI0025D68DED|nr:insulinase family protein [uncultured Bilophila sp.]